MTFTHIFSSHLQRAAKTAGLIRDAQLQLKNDTNAVRDVPDVTQLRLLMEQDFGDLEGKKWTDIQVELQNKPGFVAVETKEAMGRRASIFLDEHLLPLLGETTGSDDLTVAIVSHGIFLSTLWKQLLRRLPTKSITLSPDLQSTVRPSLEHLGGWSNTGYLELYMARDEAEMCPPSVDGAPSSPDVSHPLTPKPDETVGTVKLSQVHVQGVTGDARAPQISPEDATLSIDAKPTAAALTVPTTPVASGLAITNNWTTTIMTINGKDHLKGLKRTGGGVGSSRHDASQKGIESFFKRRKVD